MQNQTLIFWIFFVFYYIVVFLKQTPNQLKFFWYLFRFWDFAIQKFAFFPLVALECKAILNFICYSLSIFLTKMSIYMFLGQEIQKCSQICWNINRKKVRGKNHVASSEPLHHFMIQHFLFWFVEMCSV